MTHREKVINWTKSRIQKSGFISGNELAFDIAEYIGENKYQVSAMDVMESLKQCEGIHSIEYTTSSIENYRVRDLFYYNPDIKH